MYSFIEETKETSSFDIATQKFQFGLSYKIDIANVPSCSLFHQLRSNECSCAGETQSQAVCVMGYRENSGVFP